MLGTRAAALSARLLSLIPSPAAATSVRHRSLPRRSGAVRAMGAGVQIEVERKFAADISVEEIRQRVTRLGGSMSGTVGFNDTYYDTPGCELTSRDVWLRRRDFVGDGDNGAGGTSVWELKLPVVGPDEARSGGERGRD